LTERSAEDRFRESTIAFEVGCSKLEHTQCAICRVVSLQDKFNFDNICKTCQNGSAYAIHNEVIGTGCISPIWVEKIEEQQIVHYDVPEVLKVLREGEKLLIQQISVYVPLHHLSYGQLGAKGHIVSFPQDISEVCTVLPRLPKDVSTIKVVKYFKLPEGDVASKSFSIRRKHVLDALYWLKKHNVHYHNIEIKEENLSWIDNGCEQELPASFEQHIQEGELDSTSRDDRGPAQEQVAVVTDTNLDVEQCFGNISDFNNHLPKDKDSEVVESILEAERVGRTVASQASAQSIHFPYVSPQPICEYTERFIFEKAFPWLFPGGVGGFHSIMSPQPTLSDWMAKTILYGDGRFSRDKMWAFCALNYLSRHLNQTSGGFFVNSFFKNGPDNLEELQEKIARGDLSWINSIIYYSNRVVGSSSYWRARRAEVFSWINHHVEQGHGPPSFFITLSCAEYHWTEIERLIKDRCQKAGTEVPDFSKGRAGIINEYSIVVQEFFQRRVDLWLATVGKDVFKIKYHWLRYEFAPSRGQIHAHMIAICDNIDMLQKCYELTNQKDEWKMSWE
jgi:hypothetical protein